MTAAATAIKRQAAAPGSKRIPALDGVRAFASLMVVVYHFSSHIIRSADSRFAFLLHFPRRGVEGVDLFFVLSGFLISGILVEARNSPRYFSTFYKRRAFRIFPLYYLTLAGYVAAVLFPGGSAAGQGRLFENPLPLWPYWLYLQNFSMAIAGSWGAIWMAGSWSLAIEEQFYLTLPAIVRKVSDQALLRIACAGLIAPCILRALEQRTRILPGIANSVLLPMRVDALSAGIIVTLLLRNYSGAVERRLRLIRWTAVTAGCLWFLFPALPPSISVRMGFLNDSTSAVAFGLFILNVLVAPPRPLARVLSTAPARLLGNMAYSTYLFHPILLCVVFRAMRGVDPRLNTISDLTPLTLAFVLTLACSWISWTRFEAPLLARGRRFQY
jgi:peptidoglycan/LPS O-acetylase OafA/YrhL